MSWSLHTTSPTASEDLRASLVQARDLRLRGDERARILAGQDTNKAEVEILTDHMNRAIEAADAFVSPKHVVQVSISGDLAVEGVVERTTIAIDAITVE